MPPELVTAVTSSRKAVSDLAVGNVLGANVANLSLIIGTAAVIQSVAMDRVTQLFNLPAMLVMITVLFWMLRTGFRVSRREGGVLLAMYGAYLVAVVGITIATAR
ncbi:MAG TPA: hypothetical protein P5186_06620 [Candidatus Paceibacterota bacterium]|nr:hypothetical protein [Verrucomicrobiota bacterium]HRY47703.1 hypothetical protein [Candidatus Paceibacterota bacterium]HSA00406.1 hypothetical protein [Candidatus Paceibacterota bacterium]